MGRLLFQVPGWNWNASKLFRILGFGHARDLTTTSEAQGTCQQGQTQARVAGCSLGDDPGTDKRVQVRQSQRQLQNHRSLSEHGAGVAYPQHSSLHVCKTKYQFLRNGAKYHQGKRQSPDHTHRDFHNLKQSSCWASSKITAVLSGHACRWGGTPDSSPRRRSNWIPRENGFRCRTGSWMLSGRSLKLSNW